MTTALAIPDSAPSYLAALIAANPAVMAANEAALANMFSGLPPMIGINGSRFFLKEGGETKPVLDKNGNPVAVLGCVILTAKPNLEKKLYLKAYSPDSNDAPDCQSIDGITPDASCANKQAESCAGCWANVFGSGLDQQGNPTKGKRCADLKKLAVFANGKAYGFNVPPGSLQNWTAYVKDLSARNIPLPAVITTIGFDLKQPQILTFSFAGMLTEQQLPMVVDLISSQEVKDIIEFKMSGLSNQAQLPAPAAAAPAAPAQEPAKQAEAPKTNRAPKASPKAAPAPVQAAPQQTAFDLGLGGAAVEEAPLAGAAEGDLSESDIASMLGL